ncbi:MAG: pilus assembly protein N-terminal domain-containing protein [Selenomonas sp.]|uniref:type II and III secretion system protein family protein n=1 Tax=Selenomonas sp. TaxID=2053611 RepID=UPI0025F12329|nr:pilus assembly protein N-terminal domain-containing protein [Selenomonas sp.]MCR5757745.1 pilus assembly protein N-terminal domain-containing protein [Selenomonas sp.]
MGQFKKLLSQGALTAGMFCLLSAPVSAEELLSLHVNSSHYMEMPGSIIRVAIGNPEIATVTKVSSNREFLVVPHKEGSTSLLVWLSNGARYSYIVNVSPEDIGQSRMIEEAIGLPNVHVRKVGSRVLLTGTVMNQYERNYAVQTARLYVGGTTKSSISVGSYVDMTMNTKTTGKGFAEGTTGSSKVGGTNVSSEGDVIDLLHMEHPTQIKLEAQIISINPEDVSQLGIRYDGTGSSDFSSPGVFYAGDSYGAGTSGTKFSHNPWRWLTDRRNDINLAISAMVKNSKAKILSRPSVVTMSGEEASIQVGGQIPYQTYDDNGRAKTEFKDYGIILQLKPIVDSEDRIISSVHAEVSSISGETSDGNIILDKRSANSVITINSGSTMVIGGLMDSTASKTVTKIPLLGDIPVLGEFFKYSSTKKEKQELLILITPKLVDEDEASKARMSSSMKEWYDKGGQEKKVMKTVDVNESAQEAEADAVEEQANDTPVAAPRPQDENSLLDKYLDRKALPKAAAK